MAKKKISKSPKTICLCMIVNNESKSIIRCLESVYKYISFWIINDNGSTDNTPELITDFFKEKGIPGILDRTSWGGFSVNRSLACEIAERESGCDWMYVIDADDYLITPLKIPDKPANADSFIINLQEGPNVMQTRQQLFRIGCEWGFAGVVHEYPYSRPLPAGKLKVAKTTEITVKASREGARNADPLKYWKDAIAMEKDLKRVEKIPKNELPHWEKGLASRYKYYILQSWNDFGHPKNAIKWANLRVALKGKDRGFKEEVWRAYLLKSRNYKKLGYPHEEIVEAINDCIKNDKWRAEAYFELVHEYEHVNDYEKAWEVIQRIYKMKRPGDKLFIVEDYTYKFGAKKEAAWIAYKLGNYELSYKLANELCEDHSNQNEHRGWAYNVKHKNVEHILKDRITYHEDMKDIKSHDQNKVVINLDASDINKSIECLSSFLNCCQDKILVDKWFCNSDGLEDKFPFLQKGRGSGEITVNISDKYLFFHKCEIISELLNLIPKKPMGNKWALNQYNKAVKKGNKKQIEKFKKILEKDKEANDNLKYLTGPKIVYLNRDGGEDLWANDMPDLFDKGKGKLVQLSKVANSPYVIYKEGEGIWSLERISCVSRKVADEMMKEEVKEEVKNEIEIIGNKKTILF